MAETIEFTRVDDLLQGYFDALRAYNRAIGAFDMTAAELAYARRRETALYARVQKYKDALLERSISV
jgi:hypothetical protein